MQARVIAVEPGEGMRQRFTEILPNVEVLAGTAEAIPTTDASADAVIAAQAFHWFEGYTTLREIHRVLKPWGRLGLIWNVRDESVDWVRKLTDIIEVHSKGTPRHRTGTAPGKRLSRKRSCLRRCNLRPFTTITPGCRR